MSNGFKVALLALACFTTSISEFAIVGMIVWGVFSWIPSPIINLAVVQAAPEAADVMLSLNNSTTQFAYAIGAGVGGIVVATAGAHPFLERVVEVAKAVFDDLDGRMACINVINNLSLDCDCDSSACAPVMEDIGIMASLDPVALDRASLDQVYLSDDPGKDAMIGRIESHDGAHLLDYAESLGLGSQAYELIDVRNSKA